MKKYLKWLVVVLIAIVLIMFCYWFIKTNQFEFNKQDVRDVLKQIFVYSFAAGVAVCGYWWTQERQQERHDDQLFEARWNQALDIQLSALEKLVKMRSEIYIALMRLARQDSYKLIVDEDFREQVIIDIDDSFQRMSDHINFYLNSDDYYLSNTMLEMRITLTELECYIEQVLPLPDKPEEHLEHSVYLAVRSHLLKVIKLAQLMDWEIWTIKEGKILERYDVSQDDDSQWDKHEPEEEYMRWKLKEFKKERRSLGLTTTYVVLNKEIY
ncbi:hypothetical protein [Vibrio genomosp. F10]|uniref:hypothetical protein n=1 Tax=Vibrio genomosp. F10 TaxID=723171 RepID=UPI0002F187AB|nr:hypothetical protein [Vibrio genomosp. F10]OEE98695.1 hypothetical protein A1QK_12015 [Vibrio genomosp. F10 str. 9ZD137]